jgi:superfamily II DNA/RNA helicase/ribosomal protein S15P/S13E
MLITNETQEITVKNIANNILPDCDEVFFEVGYFYFSGFEQIYKRLKDVKIKILIGINYDEKIASAVISNNLIKEKYFDKLREDINETDILDQSTGIESYKLFLEKLKNGSMEIRCNPKKNDHSKFFIFKHKKERSQGGISLGSVLAGSSNFTKAGFLTNLENNYLFSDKNDFEIHLKQFNDRWKNSQDIINIDSFLEFNEKVVKKTWISKSPPPYHLFVKMLDEYFKEKTNDGILMPKEFSQGKLYNIKYQEDAILKGIDIIKKHQGVIVADVVGLGKSIIGSAIAKNLGLTTIIICPPHLQDTWEDYMNLAQISSNVVSRGRIPDAFRFLQKDREHLIIIDEAHIFRNDLTTDYTDLHKLCKNNKVVLLSATPFNNKPQDTFNMIKLFQIPTKTSIQTIENLSEEFKLLIKEYNQLKKFNPNQPKDKIKIKEAKDKISNKIRNILSPLVIRRSRLDLQSIERYKNDLDKLNISFPIRRDPELINYELNDLTSIYEETIEKISSNKLEKNRFIGARYKSTSYIKPEFIDVVAERGGYEDKALLKKSLENISDFMKRLLVRRFESCIYSFRSTLDNIIKSNHKILDYYEKEGVVPIYKGGDIPDVEDIVKEDDDIINIENFDDFPEIKKLKSKGMWLINKNELNENFHNDIKKDIKLLTNLRDKWDKILSSKNFADPKFSKFNEFIKNQLNKEKNRKLLIFSEFADTADYLYEKLKANNIRVFKYTSADAIKKENREIIKKNFDASAENQQNDYDVLVATDTIAEGFNLNRAGSIFNYDIPYNPTKVIQRVGRINRINKKLFDEIRIYNFFPTETGEKISRTKKISQLKISMFQALFGDDTKVLTKDEELESYFADEFRKKDNEEQNPENYYENLIYNLRDYEPELIKEVRELENRQRVLRKSKPNLNNNVIVYAKKGDESIFRLIDDKLEIQTKSIVDYFKIFESKKDEKSFSASENFDSKYRMVLKNLFPKTYHTALDRGKKMSLDKLKISLETIPAREHSYIKDLIKVIEEFDDLPGGYLKMIRQINKKNIEDKIKEIKKIITPEYINKSFIRAAKIDSDPEKIILSEEFLNV